VTKDNSPAELRAGARGRVDGYGKTRSDPLKARADNGAKLRFDSTGVRKAAIGLLAAMYKSGRHGTIPEALIALEVVDSYTEGRPHTMRSLSTKLGIPYTSVSRIVYSLTSEAQPNGLLRLASDTRDRRRKRIELDPEVFKRIAPQTRALERAMADYYGASVLKLKKKKTV
jgi:hypothetical protein